MLYITTRNCRDAYTAQRALRENRGPDGGMYLPFHEPSYSAEDWKELAQKPGGGDLEPLVWNKARLLGCGRVHRTESGSFRSAGSPHTGR